MTGSLGFLIETLVALLLAITIVYCVIVSRKLEALRADQTALREIVRELTLATVSAETAIGTLRMTVSQAESALVEQLSAAQDVEARLKTAQLDGNDLVSRLSLVARHAVQTAGHREPAQPPVLRPQMIPPPRPAPVAPLPQARAQAEAVCPEPATSEQNVVRNRFNFARLGRQLAEGRGRNAA